MANHYGGPTDPSGKRRRSEIFEAFRKHYGEGDGAAMRPSIRLGKQNDYPAGMYGGSDEGAIGIGVAPDIDNARVVLNFGTPVAWLALEPEQAANLAQSLMKAARKSSKKPRTLEIS